jgi:hypothetical protein
VGAAVFEAGDGIVDCYLAVDEVAVHNDHERIEATVTV